MISGDLHIIKYSILYCKLKSLTLIVLVVYYNCNGKRFAALTAACNVRNRGRRIFAFPYFLGGKKWTLYSWTFSQLITHIYNIFKKQNRIKGDLPMFPIWITGKKGRINSFVEWYCISIMSTITLRSLPIKLKSLTICWFELK